MAALGAASQAPRVSGDADEDDFFVEDERSEAERELLRALRSTR
jgi:aminoglycoside phosphotransferase